MQYEGVSVVCCDKVTALETTMMVAYIHDQRHFNTRQEVSEDTDVVFFFSFFFPFQVMFTYLLDFIRRLLGSAEAIVGGGEDPVGEVLGWAFRNGRVRMERAESRCCRGVGSHSKRGVALARWER